MAAGRGWQRGAEYGAALEIEHLKLTIAKLWRMQFGRRSERIDHQIEQMELRLEELQSAQAALPPAPRVQREEKSQSVRRALPEDLPREERVHASACALPELRSGDAQDR